jgi:hypothetical protein
MITRQFWFKGLCATFAAAVIVAISLAPIEARGGHGRGGFHHGLGGGYAARGGSSFATDRRHANDAHVKAASNDLDNVLNTKIKSICRGC